jgi:four helix bundle protein
MCMEKIQSYKDLIVYQKSYHLSLEVYRITKIFPKEELYGIVSQMRRAVVSIPLNIAEGYRRGRKEYIQFLRIAQGSCSELETLLSLSKDLLLIDNKAFDKLYQAQEEVSRLLAGLIHSLKNIQEER